MKEKTFIVGGRGAPGKSHFNKVMAERGLAKFIKPLPVQRLNIWRSDNFLEKIFRGRLDEERFVKVEWTQFDFELEKKAVERFVEIIKEEE